MDLLFTKYASPFVLLDGLIQSNGLSDFINDFIQFHQEREAWEFFLHKVFDISWDEFRKSLIPHEEEKIDVGATFVKSKNMLNNFTPE